MDYDDGLSEDGPFSPWLHPDDRLWRHPSEVADAASRRPGPVTAGIGTGGRIWALALVAGLVGALVASAIGSATGEFGHTTTVIRPMQYVVRSPAVESTAAASTAAVSPPNWPSIYATLATSLVTITADGNDGPVTASGVLWQSQGRHVYVVTDGKALAGVGSVEVSFTGGGPPLKGRTIGEDDRTGVAVVEVTDPRRPLAVLGHLSDLQIGEPVAAVSPVAAAVGGAGPLTAGTLSGIDREVHVSDGPTMLGMIGIASSTTAPAGAAVVDSHGVVVGLTSSVQSSDDNATGATFAVPIDIAEAVAEELIAGRPVTHPWLGVVEAENVLPGFATPQEVHGGAEVDSVMSPSPATDVGIEPGDIITSLNGSRVTSAASLMLATNDCRLHRPVTVGYVRGGIPTRATIVPAAQPHDVSP